jgi:hypothetical protein
VQRDADEIADEVALVPCVTAPMSDAKELLAACEEAAIEAQLARDVCCGKGGCGCAPKMQLLVAPDDVPRVAMLLRNRWNVMLAREGVQQELDDVEGGTPGGNAPTAEGEHPACPACGTAAPLVEGACSDCGLQLE